MGVLSTQSLIIPIYVNFWRLAGCGLSAIMRGYGGIHGTMSRLAAASRKPNRKMAFHISFLYHNKIDGSEIADK